MRRKDKQITDQDLLNNILTNNNICRVAFSENNIPYIVPMSYGYNNNRIFLHSAKDGRKIDIIKQNNKICFEVTDSIEVIKSENACSFGTKYRSVIGFGKIFTVSEKDKKIEALKIIMLQHTNTSDWKFKDSMIEKINILVIKIDSLAGKKSGL